MISHHAHLATYAVSFGILICQNVLSIVFLAAAGFKLHDLAGSVEAIEAYDLLPPALARVAGRVLPCVELAVGLGILIDPLFQPAAIAAATLLAGFLLAQLSVLARGLKVGCGCFGPGDAESDPVGPATVARTASLLLMLGAVSALYWYGAGPLPLAAPGVYDGIAALVCYVTSINLVLVWASLRAAHFAGIRSRSARGG